MTTERDLSEVLKALANPARLQLMQWLREPVTSFAEFEPIADRETVGVCVTHLQAKSGLAQSTVSSYMTTLERAGLVTSTRVGKWTHYRRDEARIAEAMDLLHATI
ncbi:ArsR/SmtB family transcription factor [Aeromicrobium endophyticum]|nr:metalloregulator ArsR/SmtB family transcription factor [Aeromicrobium endophyticum]